MDLKKIIAILLAVALAAVLVILIRSDRSDKATAQASAKPAVTAAPEAEATPEETVGRYHIAVLSNSELEHYPLVRIDLDGMDVPVYACTDFDGTVRFFVYGYEETTGQYGFLPAYPAYPEVRVDNSEGFAELPRLAKGWTAADSEYEMLTFASVNGGEAQYYYPADENGDMRDGAIPVSVEEFDHVFGAYFVFDEQHKALICRLEGMPDTPEPDETETPSAAPTAEPTAEPTPTAAPGGKTTPKPNRTPKPSDAATAEPTETPSTQPTAEPTEAPSEGWHWELVWVVDQEEVKHREWHCHVCGKVFLDESSCMQDQAYHKEHDGVTGWHVEWVVDQEEVGHWEPVQVPDP